MNRLSRTVLASLAAALLLPAAAAAQEPITSPFRYLERTQGLGVHAGYLFTHPNVSLTDSTEAEIGYRSAPMVGVRYGVRFGGPFTGEAGAFLALTERRIAFATANADSTIVTPVFTGETASTPLVGLEGTIRFHLTGDRTWNRLAPFLSLSGGVVSELGGTSDTEASTLAETERFDFGPTFAVGGSVGVDYFPSQRFSLRVELSERLWRETAPPGLQPRGTGKQSDWSPNTGVSVGAAFHF